MADKITNAKTSLSGEEVIVRAVQFFGTKKFRTGSQSARVATFDGKPPIPWGMLFLTILGLLFFIIPGIIMYVIVLRKMYRFQNLVVTANSIAGGTEVSISHPSWAAATVRRFIDVLPPLAASSVAAPPPLPPQ